MRGAVFFGGGQLVNSFCRALVGRRRDRSFIGIERDQGYVSVAGKRIGA